ncbi:hypothetical protein [Halodesulfovibrio marinisediminis]|uniref:Uncharacterized protein n=1 Tax=Halodesulfovibrio marinisediminis DSM 17456 TaxID=1121457 RepID=A0A1N6IFJ2_9BACT|nr:hypothetical protein [Halodesulfovibrio marinisediminis]SIO30802.1 hypothetical protein SAMN02745161_2701 [Halodesulfovibrio marinisediminis DSM 17456]
MSMKKVIAVGFIVLFWGASCYAKPSNMVDPLGSYQSRDIMEVLCNAAEGVWSRGVSDYAFFCTPGSKDEVYEVQVIGRPRENVRLYKLTRVTFMSMHMVYRITLKDQDTILVEGMDSDGEKPTINGKKIFYQIMDGYINRLPSRKTDN